jgi:hypothetical protein
MVINYFIRNVYGKPKIYVTGRLAEQIYTLTRRQTVEPRDLEALRFMGHEIQRVEDPEGNLVHEGSIY